MSDSSANQSAYAALAVACGSAIAYAIAHAIKNGMCRRIRVFGRCIDSDCRRANDGIEDTSDRRRSIHGPPDIAGPLGRLNSCAPPNADKVEADSPTGPARSETMV